MPGPFASLAPILLGTLGTSQSITLTRYAVGSYDGSGNWQRGASTSIPLDAFVEHSSPKSIEQLPENERTDEAIDIYTGQPLQVSDEAAQLESDIVAWNGRSYKVVKLDNRAEFLGLSKAIATRIGS